MENGTCKENWDKNLIEFTFNQIRKRDENGKKWKMKFILKIE